MIDATFNELQVLIDKWNCDKNFGDWLFTIGLGKNVVIRGGCFVGLTFETEQEYLAFKLKYL
jgi:hypothetical protein